MLIPFLFLSIPPDDLGPYQKSTAKVFKHPWLEVTWLKPAAKKQRPQNRRARMAFESITIQKGWVGEMHPVRDVRHLIGRLMFPLKTVCPFNWKNGAEGQGCL